MPEFPPESAFKDTRWELTGDTVAELLRLEAKVKEEIASLHPMTPRARHGRDLLDYISSLLRLTNPWV